MSKRILITGGAGFIGSNFIRYLFNRYEDYQIIVMDALTYAGSLYNFSPELIGDPRFSFWHGDVCNSALVLDLVNRVDVVIHFAAETHVARSIHDDRKFFETDVLGTQSVANAVLRNKDRIERFIHISSSEVYGTALTVPMTEQHPLNPLSPYAAAKAGADRLVYSYVHTYDIPAIILRPFNQFGPYQHLEKVIPRFITSAILDEQLTVHGRGEAKRDWLYVEDTCEYIDTVLHSDIDQVRGEVFNLGSGFDKSVVYIARTILKIMNKPESLLFFMEERPAQVLHHISSTDKAARILGIKSGRKFEEGLEETIRWYSDNRRWWEKSLAMRCVAIMTGNGAQQYY